MEKKSSFTFFDINVCDKGMKTANIQDEKPPTDGINKASFTNVIKIRKFQKTVLIVHFTPYPLLD